MIVDVRPTIGGARVARMELSLGFLLGILASTIAAVALDHATRPRITISLARNRAQGQIAGSPAHEFFHVVVRNSPARWPLTGRRPAWSCKATLEIVSADGR